MTFTKASTLKDGFRRRKTRYRSSVLMETATVGLNGTFPTKPSSASADAVVSSPVDEVLTLIDVESVWTSIAAISRSILGGGGL